MHYSLITVLVLALLGFSAAAPSIDEKEMFCDFLYNLETSRIFLLEVLVDNALAVAKEVQPLLARDSQFEKYLTEDIAYAGLTGDVEKKISFLNKFNWAYTRFILDKWRYDDPLELVYEYRNMTLNNKEKMKKFDEELKTKANQLLREIWTASPETKKEFSDEVSTYLNRNHENPHCMLDRLLRLKSKYGCTDTER